MMLEEARRTEVDSSCLHRVYLFSTLLLLHFYIITIRETLNKTKNDAAVVVGHDVDILA